MAQVYNIPSVYNLLANSDSPDIRNARLHLELHTEKRLQVSEGNIPAAEKTRRKITVSVIGKGRGADCVGRPWDLPSLEILST